VLYKQVVIAACVPSYAVGEFALREVGGIELTGRGLNKVAVRIGSEMAESRDARTEAYFAEPLPRQHAPPKTPLSLACVSVDGGRMQTRDEGTAPGVHHPHWRETKNALFLRMKSPSFACDPHPELPARFADRAGLRTLLPGVAEGGAPDDIEKPSPTPREDSPPAWRPEPLFRTCLSSLADSDTFGRMMEVEADTRGFYHAQKKAFVSDGLHYNWTIQRRHFPQFTPILDFVHAAERLFAAARAVCDDADRRWGEYLRWARACWAGNVEEVLAELAAHQQRLGPPPAGAAPEDPRRLLAEAIGYFRSNTPRMNYPEYRRRGLPTTSSHMESLVKEISLRVKGTEKFFNDGTSGEAILQLRAAALCDDARLERFLANRPGHPFHPNVPRRSPIATAG